MFLLVKVLVCFGWVCAISISTLCVLMIVKAVAENAMFATNKNVCVKIKRMPNIAAIKKENSIIDEICNFCNLENGYCDSLLSDRMMLQDLYDELVETSKERNDGNYAFSRDILNYRVDNSEARSKLLENLVTYLALRRETNANLLQHRRAT